MLNIAVTYFFLLGLFALIGFLRGWQREVIAMAGLIASLAALAQFGFRVVEIFTDIPPQGTLPQDNPDPFSTMFWIQFGFHIMIAFFSYQMVSRIADLAMRGRLGERIRTGLEAKIVGAFVGLLNGYLLIGGIWGFLEFAMNQGQSGYYRLGDAARYAFEPEIIIRPAIDTFAWDLARYLPQFIDPTAWIIAFFIVFFIVIIALL